MEKENQTDKDHLLNDFVDRDKEFDFEKLASIMQSPGNEALQEEFERLRRLADLSVDGEKIWDNIQSRVERKPRKAIARYLKYVAAVVLPLCAGVLGWMVYPEEKPSPAVVAEVISPGKPRAYLQLSGGERLSLSTQTRDTLLVERGTSVRVDSTGRISYLSPGNKAAKENVYNTIVVPRSGEYKLELADGTRVWLNSESELRYPVEFVGDWRDVYLKGEGYFEVAPDAEKPFRVLVDDMVVRVLGTSFDVNAYRDRGGVLTTLLSGKVAIQDRSGRSLVEMEPDQQVDFKDGVAVVSEVDARKSVSWIDGKFYFEEMPLESIMEQLRRWYDIEVFFVGQDLKSYEFTGVIHKDFSADQIFEIIEKTTRVKFSVKGRSVTVNYK